MIVDRTPSSTVARRRTKVRAIALGVVIGGVFLVLIGQLFYLQVIRGWEFKRQARAVTRRELPIPAQRGEIFDRHYDFPLVVNQDSFAVDVIPAEVGGERREPLFEQLAAILRIDPQEIHQRVPPRFYHLYQPVEIKGGVGFETVAYLAEHIDEFPGTSWHNKPIRNYLATESLAHVIGYVGDITREELQVLYNEGYGFGTVLGKSGIEKQYDRTLRGVDGKRFRTVDVREKSLTLPPEEDLPPEPGKNLVLTIDRHIQLLCEKALGARIGSVVVLKPTTGEILAMVSYPYFDANLLYTDRGPEVFTRLSLDPTFPFINRAIQSVYPPASTFKVVMATALVEEEVFPITRKITCHGSIEYGDRVFHCHARKTGHGALDLFGGMAQSCDVYFYTVGDELGVERISYYSREFGLGQLTGVDLPGEVAGFVPTPEWKQATRHMKWLGGDTLNISIGQGFLLVSPLQMANMVAMVANEGRIYRPHILKEVREPLSGQVIRAMEPEILRVAPVRRETLEVVQETMRGVVTEGTANVVITTKAVEVAGKTGTAEVGKEEQWHSWFAAYAPYQTDDPDERVVVVVSVEAENEWEWWAPKAADVIFQGIFADQTYEEAVETLRPWWYLQQQREVQDEVVQR
ncbi:MAG: penicillin-binding protein 2 [Spirochaetales bacterium]|nr:penicillin-binding protein 2 [Spirochaetales bacterium]